MKNKFQIWSERPFNLWLCFLLVNTVAPPCTLCVCVWCHCGLRFSWIFELENAPRCISKHICASECVFMRKSVFRVKECQDKYINFSVLHCVERQNCGNLIRPDCVFDCVCVCVCVREGKSEEEGELTLHPGLSSGNGCWRPFCQNLASHGQECAMCAAKREECERQRMCLRVWLCLCYFFLVICFLIKKNSKSWW